MARRWHETDEESYAALADELNDHDVDMTIDDFEPLMVEEAHRYAEANGLSWPPVAGDFDRYYDRKVNS